MRYSRYMARKSSVQLDREIAEVLRPAGKLVFKKVSPDRWEATAFSKKLKHDVLFTINRRKHHGLTSYFAEQVGYVPIPMPFRTLSAAKDWASFRAFGTT